MYLGLVYRGKGDSPIRLEDFREFNFTIKFSGRTIQNLSEVNLIPVKLLILPYYM